MLTITIATIFPNIFPGVLGVSLLKQAMKKNLWKLEILDLKDFSFNKRIDDKLFGGLPGMLIKPEVIEKLIESNKWDRVFYTNPTGIILNQTFLVKLSQQIINVPLYHILIICGRYEGIDTRVIEYYKIEEFSLGKFILCGGEIPTMSLVEGLVRLLPGVLGNQESLNDESFQQEDYIQYKKYTRPREWRNICVPEVLFSGNHKQINQWKKNTKNTTQSYLNEISSNPIEDTHL
jgi:tRNA (guanine37-N1)-methyltransferase